MRLESLLDGTMIKVYQEDPNTFEIPATTLATKQFDNSVFANMISLGYLSKLLEGFIPQENFLQAIKESVRDNLVKIDIEAFEIGNNWKKN